MAFLENFNDALGAVIWGPLMMLLMVGTGIYLTVRCGFFQLTKIPVIWKSTVGSLFQKKGEKHEQRMTPFQAVSTALAGTMGIGNISGVAAAIVIGGPGSIFWMWVSAFFGMATKYAEVVLAIRFRQCDKSGGYHGGAMYYIERGVGSRWLAVLFAVLCTVASFGIGNMVQANAVAQAAHNSYGVSTIIAGLLLAFICGLVIIGGVKRIGRIAEIVVPFMTVLYFAGAVVVLIVNRERFFDAFGLIFRYAFSFSSVGGGISGYVILLAMRYGLSRGVFSNEAGLGSAPIAHACADCRSGVEQGFWSVFEVFLDTILMCTITALVILTSDCWCGGLTGTELTSAAFGEVLGSWGSGFITLAVILFGFCSIIGWCCYGEKCVEYLSKKRRSVKLYRIVFVVMIVVGACIRMELVWNLSDTFNGLMAIPNLLAVLLLSRYVVEETHTYFHRN